MISWGDLPQPEEVIVTNPRTGILEFTWEAVNGGSEHALILAYSDELHKSGDLCGSGKSEGLHELDCQNLIGREADIYMGFVSEERARCSDSVYLGRIKID